MKATGIVRRIDDLGRVVIPKEIRRTLRIREGDPLEIYTEKDGGVVFRKYSPMGGAGGLAGRSAIRCTGRRGSRWQCATGAPAVIAVSGLGGASWWTSASATG